MSSRWSRRIVAVFVGAVMLALIPSVSLGGGTTRVRANDNNTWGPDFKHTYRGMTVKWTNPSPRRHNISSYNKGADWSFSKRLPRGETRSKTFTRRGGYYYRCTLHSTMNNGDCNDMCGLIHVQS